MRSLLTFIFFSFCVSFSFAQKTPAQTNSIERPRLVVGIVIDQMRWDYLYRYYDVYKTNGGFKRLMGEGFTCENAFIPYTPTVTAAGHTCVYTGSVPAIHGIVGNNWYDNITKRGVYCTDDDSVQTVGSNTPAGKMSPKNMFATTIGDELKLATNFKSKVIGVAIKDRGAILPAGHTANAAYWYDYKTGDFITSTYYMNELPKWVQAFNARKVVDSLYKLNWHLYLPKEVYAKYCTADDKPYENKPLGKATSTFPYSLSQFAGKEYGRIASTPYGNTLTEAMAEAAVKAESLGSNGTTDMLTVSFSSPDYIGHSFGPNSWEQLDNYARLDATLGKFFAFLDATVGKGAYTVFLTADHGVAHVPNFSVENKLPGGAFNDVKVLNDVNAALKTKFGYDKLALDFVNYLVVFNNDLIDSANLDKAAIHKTVIDVLLKQKEIAQAFEIKDVMNTTITAKQREMMSNGYFPSRCGEIQFILKPGYVEGNGNGTSHGLWNPYDSHIPLLWYGWGIKHGKTNRETYMTDIAATLAGMLHIQMPSGCIGHVVEEVMK
ncbi:alkaline phosphatase family protein [Panacibacter ginsenosidivorans]|uniref:Alkaline phosphatase family protein n=1 Tax=Panacibacter ginsenosidivorans TaxID=1813871 RepID=A0A5B8VCZ6_9BACT|nr:alkaline phosphatase PafA [Panacibacter ginsenosidivorans]QEC69407.1 alkaline phosphatase family protein [Panacibacter ginsenosidivorans]